VIVSVGYELQEFRSGADQPGGDKRILHLSRFPAEVDAHYDVEVGVQADLSRTLDALAAATGRRFGMGTSGARIRRLLSDELARGAGDDSFPLKPQRVVSDTRAALDRSDIVLVDTGAVKMWMARPVSHLRVQHLPVLQWPVHHGVRAAGAIGQARCARKTSAGCRGRRAF